MDRLDFYGCLGVTREASQEDIRRAFRRMVRHSHPDLNPDDPDAAKRLRDVIAAYRILGNPSSRARYDCVDTLFGPRKISRDDVADQKSAFWEERFYRRRSYSSSSYQQTASSRRPFVIGLLLVWLAAVLMFWVIRSEWFTRSPFDNTPRWQMQSGLRLDEDPAKNPPDPRNDWAIEYWSHEYHLNGSNRIAKEELGRRYASFAISALRRGDRDLALACAQRATALSPDLPEVRQALHLSQPKAALPDDKAKPVASAAGPGSI